MYRVRETESEPTEAKDLAAVRKFKKRAGNRVFRAVMSEVNGHKYQNRTHKAQDNTDVQIVHEDDAGNIEFIAAMNVEYASYLNESGWSDFDRKVAAAILDVDSMFENL